MTVEQATGAYVRYKEKYHLDIHIMIILAAPKQHRSNYKLRCKAAIVLVIDTDSKWVCSNDIYESLYIKLRFSIMGCIFQTSIYVLVHISAHFPNMNILVYICVDFPNMQTLVNISAHFPNKHGIDFPKLHEIHFLNLHEIHFPNNMWYISQTCIRYISHTAWDSFPKLAWNTFSQQTWDTILKQAWDTFPKHAWGIHFPNKRGIHCPDIHEIHQMKSNLLKRYISELLFVQLNAFQLI